MTKPLTLSQKKQQDILVAAQAEFKEKGFSAASMDSLAKRAGVSKRTVYNHFPSKESLFKEILQQLCNSFFQAANTKYQNNIPLSEQLSQIAKNYLSLLSDEKFKALNRIILGELIRSPELCNQILSQSDCQDNEMENWIADAIRDKKLKNVEPKYAAEQFTGLLKATSFWPQLLMNIEPEPQQTEKIIDDTVFMFLARYQLN